MYVGASQVALVVNSLPANLGDVRDTGSIPGSGRSPGGGHGNPLQYSCLEHPMDRGAWWATVYGVAKSLAQLKWLSTHTWMYDICRVLCVCEKWSWQPFVFYFSIYPCVCLSPLSRVWFFVNPWTLAHQAPLSMGCSRQEYWSGLPFPSPGDLPDPGIEPRSPALQADSLLSHREDLIYSCNRDFIIHQISMSFFTLPILLCSKCESHMSRLDNEIVKSHSDL